MRTETEPKNACVPLPLPAAVESTCVVRQLGCIPYEDALRLQEELASTENRVAFARQAYNDAVMSYNTYRESFPQNQVAGMFGFKEAPPFEIELGAEREAPRVSF